MRIKAFVVPNYLAHRKHNPVKYPLFHSVNLITLDVIILATI
jgi:hypothetical protein